MFDLHFFEQVKKMMAWTQPAPPIQYVNEHMYREVLNTSIANGPGVTLYCGATEMEMNEAWLKTYIAATYPPYFGKELAFGVHFKGVSHKCIALY